MNISALISKHKAFEAESLWISHNEWGNWFNFEIIWSRKQDHAGPRITVQIMKWYACVQVYDTRHWNCEKKDWYPDGHSFGWVEVNPGEWEQKEEQK